MTRDNNTMTHVLIRVCENGYVVNPYPVNRDDMLPEETYVAADFQSLISLLAKQLKPFDGSPPDMSKTYVGPGMARGAAT